MRGLFVPPHATLTGDANRTDRAVVSSVKRKTDVLGPPFELRPAPDPGPVTAREVEEILTEWQLRLGLERWEIEIAWTEPLNEEETLAEIEPHNPYDVAVLRLSSAWSASLPWFDMFMLFSTSLAKKNLPSEGTIMICSLSESFSATILLIRRGFCFRMAPSFFASG